MPAGWPGAAKWPTAREALGMRLHSLVDLVAIEGQHDGGMVRRARPAQRDKVAVALR